VSLSLDIRALRETAERIKREQFTLSENSLINNLPDYAEYKEKRGQYYGLKKALEIIEDVEKFLNK